MKLIIQIPCYNEEKTLPKTLADLPKTIDGIDEIEVLVINDGSTDDTVKVARRNGVKNIVSFRQHRGLAAAFSEGLNKALSLGADIIINTDADNQYQAKYIKDIVSPILKHEADMVIGCRPIKKMKDFSLLKKILHLLGNRVVRRFTGLNISDATSGFRAYSREAALKLNIISEFTYTIESIIQASAKRIAIATVPIEVNPKERKSRLFKSMRQYIAKSVNTILRIYFMYKPLSLFSWLGGILLTLGLALSIRYLYFFFQGTGRGHVQSVILAAALLIIGSFVVLLGILANLLISSRILQEEILYRIKKEDLRKK